jgi:hypothetical protein
VGILYSQASKSLARRTECEVDVGINLGLFTHEVSSTSGNPAVTQSLPETLYRATVLNAEPNAKPNNGL